MTRQERPELTISSSPNNPSQLCIQLGCPIGCVCFLYQPTMTLLASSFAIRLGRTVPFFESWPVESEKEGEGRGQHELNRTSALSER